VDGGGGARPVLRNLTVGPRDGIPVTARAI